MSTPASTPPPPSAIDNYFARFPDFSYNPANPAATQFQRLCKFNGWRIFGVGLTNEGKEERSEFNAAFAEEFAEKFGYLEEDGKEDKKQKWLYLAQVLEVDPLPETITQFKKVNAGIWVNIFDVLQAEKTGGTARRFENLGALARYSTNRKKVFPKVEAKGGALKFLLKKILARRREPDGGVSLANAFVKMAI